MAKTVIPEDLLLTEMILSIHNEVQSAVDYIADQAGREGTELGRSTALMSIQNLRVKIPFQLQFEQQTKKFSASGIQAPALKNLTLRKGFPIDIGQPTKMGLFTKVKVLQQTPAAVAPSDSASETAPQPPLAGEIEIVFSPVKRD